MTHGKPTQKVERPTRSTDITRDELVAPVPWSGESSDVGDIARIENDSWANLELGVSENSVPLNPMVNDHYPY